MGGRCAAEPARFLSISRALRAPFCLGAGPLAGGGTEGGLLGVGGPGGPENSPAQRRGPGCGNTPNREGLARMTEAGRTSGHPATARSGRDKLAPRHAKALATVARIASNRRSLFRR